MRHGAKRPIHSHSLSYTNEPCKTRLKDKNSYDGTYMYDLKLGWLKKKEKTFFKNQIAFGATCIINWVLLTGIIDFLKKKKKWKEQIFFRIFGNIFLAHTNLQIL